MLKPFLIALLAAFVVDANPLAPILYNNTLVLGLDMPRFAEEYFELEEGQEEEEVKNPLHKDRHLNGKIPYFLADWLAEKGERYGFSVGQYARMLLFFSDLLLNGETPDIAQLEQLSIEETLYFPAEYHLNFRVSNAAMVNYIELEKEARNLNTGVYLVALLIAWMRKDVGEEGIPTVKNEKGKPVAPVSIKRTKKKENVTLAGSLKSKVKQLRKAGWAYYEIADRLDITRQEAYELVNE